MNPPRITIEAELSRDGLMAVRDAIDDLIASLGFPPGGTSSSKVRQQRADKKVSEVWARVGGKLKRFLATTAQEFGDDEFTMDDAASVLQVTPQTVRSWHRNLGRTLRQVDQAIPDPPLLRSRSDGHKNLYSYVPEVRYAILSRDMPLRELE